MKRIFFVVALLILTFGLSLALIVGCGGGSSDSGGGYSSGGDTGPTASPSPTSSNATDKGVLMGKAIDTNGAAIGGVTVSCSGLTGSTNAQGFFSFNNVTPGTGICVNFYKSGYVATVRVVSVFAGDASFVNCTMTAVTATQTVDASTGGTCTDGRSTVVLPANAIVTSGGAPYTGAVTVNMTTREPSDVNYIESFPGTFTGVTTNPRIVGGKKISPRADVTLISWGFTTITLTDAAGNPLNLANGQTATVRIPIDPANDPGKATVPFWYLDPATGKWIDGGDATRSADNAYYQLQAAHFSTINIDEICDPAQTSSKQVTVKDLSGNPIQNAHVFVQGSRNSGSGYTDANGQVTIIRILPNSTITVWAEVGTLKSTPQQEQSGSAGQTITNTISIGNPVGTVTMTWGANPRDLDAHLQGPTDGGGTFEIYYGDKGTLSGSPFAMLDTDATQGYGPEIITIGKWIPGTYHYFVKKYAGDGGIEASGAVVDLVIPKQGVNRVYNVPTSNTGGKVVWAVFDVTVDGSGNVTVTDINTFIDDTLRTSRKIKK
jgi:hypothetical protein